MNFVKRFTRLLFYFGALYMLAVLTGCAKSTTYGAVQFITTPAGAEVINLRDDSNLGTTPLKVVWETDDGKPEYVSVEFRKRGYKEKITSMWVNKRHESRARAMDEPQPVNVDLEKRK